MELEEIFDENGNFAEAFNPYRNERDSNGELFDDDGCATRCYGELFDFIKSHNFSPFSDVVKYFYASQMDDVTHGNYPAIYMWK